MRTIKKEQKETGIDILESIIGGTEARPKPPADVEQAIYQQVLEDWRVLVAIRKKKKRAVYWSVAASVLVALLMSPVIFQSIRVNETIASLGVVENHKGSVSVVEVEKRFQPASVATAKLLFPGQSILTAANSGVSINWGNGNTVRVDQNTELKLVSKTEIELVFGRVYVDMPPVSGQGQSEVKLIVVTRFGLVNHTGTQFMVSSHADSVEVKVREGTVLINKNQQVIVTQKGQQTTLDDSDRLSNESILTYGPDWQWVEQLTPGFLLEGKTLGEFFTWVGRESGMEIMFVTKEAEDIARQTVMHGSVDAGPLPALELVLQTSDLSWYEQDGKICLFVSN